MGEKSGFAKYPKVGLDGGGDFPHHAAMDLINKIEAFCTEHGLSDGQFGILALNDKNFVPQLREGRDVRLSTLERVQGFMAAYRPEQAA
jgi:hypothetical protein